MILGKRRMAAVLGAVAVIASGAFAAAPPAHAYAACSVVPGRTLGADIKVGPVTTRVPAVSEITLCAGTGSAPVYQVKTYGGTCRSGCLSVFVGGGSVDAEGLWVSWKEDGVQKNAPIDPAPIPGPAGICVISTGMPDSPDPNCFISIGPDDPSGVIQPIVDFASGVIGNVMNTVTKVKTITCAAIPDWYRPGYGYQDFCTNPIGWTQAVADTGVTTTCNTIPDAYDQYGNRYDFCTNPVGWSNVWVTYTYNTACGTIPPAYRGYPYYYYVEFCDDPIGWTAAMLDKLCNKLCDATTITPYLIELKEVFDQNVQVSYY